MMQLFQSIIGTFYNQPKLCPNTTWDPNATALAINSSGPILPLLTNRQNTLVAASRNDTLISIWSSPSFDDHQILFHVIDRLETSETTVHFFIGHKFSFELTKFFAKGFLFEWDKCHFIFIRSRRRKTKENSLVFLFDQSNRIWYNRKKKHFPWQNISSEKIKFVGEKMMDYHYGQFHRNKSIGFMINCSWIRRFLHQLRWIIERKNIPKHKVSITDSFFFFQWNWSNQFE